MNKVLVSACLLGFRCRWHGKKTSPSSNVRKFVKENPDTILVPVCPEELGGLTTPRPPAKRVKGEVFETSEDKKLRRSVTGKNITAAFRLGSLTTLRMAQDSHITLAILCKFSPSCDKNGITGRLLTDHGILVTNTF